MAIVGVMVSNGIDVIWFDFVVVISRDASDYALIGLIYLYYKE